MSEEGPERDRLERLYARARALPASAREPFLRAACVEDPGLADEILSLLDESDAAEAFFGALGDALVSTSIDPELAPGAVKEGHGAWRTATVGDDLRPGHEIRHYRIVERVGRGGMGAVYRARDLRLGRDVALKLLPPDLESTAADRLLLEASAAAVLEHPNICTIYEVGEAEDGRPYLAMAYYPGETLEARLRRGPLAAEEVARVGAAMARGLAAAHGRGIVHGDVKPGNVMLTAGGGVKLLDFGLARMGDRGPSRPGAAYGTVAYMSPEQARGEPLDPGADLWSLGVVLYEMLAGTRPFPGGDPGIVLHAILHGRPPPIGGAAPRAPEPLAHLVDRLLRRDRTSPTPTAGEVAAELDRLAPPASSSGEPRDHREAEGARRRPSGIAALLAGTLLTAVALVALPPRREDRPADADAGRRAVRVPDVAAHELYLRGTDQALLRSDSGVRLGVEYLERAVAVDSGHAPAFAGLARMYLVLAGRDDPGRPPEELRARALEAASRAIALDDSLAEGHAVMGLIRHYDASDIAGGEAELRRAIALDPSAALPRQWLAQLYLQTGRSGEALAVAVEALEADPLSPSAHAEVAHAWLAHGRPDSALAHLDRIAAVQPPLLRAAGYRAQAYAMKEMWPEAIEAIRLHAAADHPSALGLYGYLLARTGRGDEARSVRSWLLALQRDGGGGAFEVALVDAGLGDLDRAFSGFEAAIDDRSGLTPSQYLMMPILRELRDDPRFGALRERLGLPDR